MGNCLLKEQKIILGAIIFTLKGRSVFLQAKVRLVSVKKLLNWLIKLKNYLTQSFHLLSLFKPKKLKQSQIQTSNSNQCFNRFNDRNQMKGQSQVESTLTPISSKECGAGFVGVTWKLTTEYVREGGMG